MRPDQRKKGKNLPHNKQRFFDPTSHSKSTDFLKKSKFDSDKKFSCTDRVSVNQESEFCRHAAVIICEKHECESENIDDLYKGFDIGKVLSETENIDFQYQYRDTNLIENYNISTQEPSNIYENIVDYCLNILRCIPSDQISNLPNKWLDGQENIQRKRETSIALNTWVNEIDEVERVEHMKRKKIFESNSFKKLFKSKELLKYNQQKKKKQEKNIKIKFKSSRSTKKLTINQDIRALDEKNNLNSPKQFVNPIHSNKDVGLKSDNLKDEKRKVHFNKTESKNEILLELEKNLDDLLLL